MNWSENESNWRVKELRKSGTKKLEEIGNILDYQARRKANLVNVLFNILVGVSVVVPLAMSLFVNPLTIIISVAAILFTAYLSFVKRFTPRSNYDRLFSRYRNQLERRSSSE